MLHSIKTVLTYPSVSFPARSISSNLGRQTCAVRFCSDNNRAGKMDKTQKPSEESKQGDTMSHSFGEGYATRSDEEGFGGIYGGNQAKPVEDSDFDKTQGSEVKEKEKGRHQTSANT